jgi:hypothetical protein
MSSASKQARWAFDIVQLEEREKEASVKEPSHVQKLVNRRSSELPPANMWRTHQTTGSASSMSSFNSGGPSSYTQSFVPFRPRTPAAPLLGPVPLPKQESTTYTPRPGSPQVILLDKALQPNSPSLFQIDLSYPTWRYQESLDTDMRAKYGTTLQRSACDPPVRSLKVIIQTNSYEADFVIGINNTDVAEDRPFVTVGAVLGGIRQQLRMRLDMTTSVTAELRTFFERRVATVNCGANLSREAYEANRKKEKDEGYRVADKLLGQTGFAGLTITGISPQNEEYDLPVRLELQTPKRYQRVSQ